MDDPPFNQGRVGFDPKNQYIGLDTPLDQIKDAGTKSANPMDTNWGGAAYTQNLIDNDTYVGRYVTKPSIISSPGINPDLDAPRPVSSSSENSQYSMNNIASNNPNANSVSTTIQAASISQTTSA